MSVIEQEKPRTKPDPLAGEIIDCDVHVVLADGLNSLTPYLDRPWRQRLETKGATLGLGSLPPRLAVPNGGHAIRPDAATPEGKPGGSSPDHMIFDHIEPHGIRYAVCTSLQAGALAVALAGPDESVALCRAFNDYFIDKWKLEKGGALRYAMAVPTQVPTEAAKEIDRLAAITGIAAVFMPLLNIPMGNRHYHPIYEAAGRNGLAIYLHVTGTENVYHGAPVVAGGWPESYAERYVSLSQVGEANLASLIFSGVLERFPELKVLFVEFGASWLLGTMWRMDKAWRAVRFDVPWVKRSPIDYITDRVRLSTQPLDEPANPEDLKDLIRLTGDHLLCFASDYPHWDNDMPGASLRMLSAQSRRRILVENGGGILRF